MSLDFTPEQDELRATVRRFLADRAPLSWLRSEYEDPKWSADDVWRGMAGLGLQGILVPETLGGLGLGLVDMGVVAEELGRALHPGPFFSSAVTATSALLAVGGDDEAAADLLASMATGEATATLALLEPGRDRRWRSPTVEAAPSAGGWSLSGTKVHVPDGASVDTLLVTAAVPEGVGLFAVDAGGAVVSPEDVLDGTRKQAAVELSGTPARRIGSGDATAPLGQALDAVRIATVADGVGAAEAALHICLAYAKERQTFGKPIGAYQHVQRLCVEMYKAVEMCRAAAYVGMFTVDAGEAEEAHRVALVASACASRWLPLAANNSIQIHGGIGVTWEHDIHFFFKRCLSAASAFGGSVATHSELATLIMG